MTATANKNNMRLISVVMKEDTKEHRTEDTISMMEYGYSNYGSENIIDSSKFEEIMIIKNAKEKKVKYYLEKDVNLIVSRDTKNIDYKINKKLYDLKAPINKSTKVGKLTIEYENNIYEYDLIVKDDIEKASLLNIISSIFENMISGIKY